MQNLSQRIARTLTALLLAIFGCIPCAASGHSLSPKLDRPIHIYRELIPLGSEVFTYLNGKQHQVFYVMASARNREFAGEQICMEGERHVLKTPGGLPVQNYPREMKFRVSVSERDNYLLLDAPFPVNSHTDSFSDFITSLKFEMRIFHALKARLIRPTKIIHIGIPPDVPASERIYEVTFDVGDVPISDRIVMHVLTDQGDRLAKFNFDLY